MQNEGQVSTERPTAGRYWEIELRKVDHREHLTTVYVPLSVADNEEDAAELAREEACSDDSQYTWLSVRTKWDIEVEFVQEAE